MAISLGGFSGGGGSGAVSSVNGQTGVVVISGDDVAADHSASHYTAANSNIDGHLSGIDTKLGTLASGLTYKGTFNATAGTPSLANAEQGDLYVIDTAGTIYGVTWAIGDHLLVNADMGGSITNSKIDKIDNTEPTNVLITTNNLSDLTSASTARTNLGLGSASTSASTDFLQVSNNLSDLNSASTARTNLGLGNVATLSTGVSNGNVIVADSTGLPEIDGSQLTGITATDSTKLAIANNLSDLNSASTARTNLGLGNVATLSTGVSNGNVIVADSTGLPEIDGSQLTGITATDSTKLAIANNLSDLNNATTARTNLGLATVASTGAYSDLSGTPSLATVATTGAYSDLSGTPSVGYPVQIAVGGIDETGTGGSDNSTDIQLNTALLLTTASANPVEVKLPLISTASDGDVVIIVRKNSGSLKISQHDSESVSNPIMYLDQGFGTNFTITNNQQQIHVRFDSASSGRWYIYDKAQGTAALSNTSDFLSATGSDALGGDIDVNGHDIVSSSNGNIEVAPDGNGSFIIKGNATSGSGRIVLNCEQNSHGITLKGPPHSAAASYTLTLPNDDGDAGEVLKTDGNGNLDWVAQSGGSNPTVTTDSSGSDTTISTTTGIEEVHLINNLSNNVTITIPGATSAGYKYNIKRLGSGTVTIQANSGTIDNANSFSLASQFDSVTLVSDATNYHII